MERSVRILTGLGVALILWCAFYTAGTMPTEYRKVIDYSSIIHDASLVAFFKFIIVSLPVFILAVFYVPKKRDGDGSPPPHQLQKIFYLAPLLLFYLYGALSEEWSIEDFVAIAVVVTTYCFLILWFYSSALIRSVALIFSLLSVVIFAGYYSGTIQRDNMANVRDGFLFTVRGEASPCYHVLLRTTDGLLVYDMAADAYAFLYHKDIHAWGEACSVAAEG